MVAHARSAQATISGTDERRSPVKSAASAYGADTFLNAHVQQLAMRQAEPPKQTVSRPTVPADSWLMQKQKKAAELNEHGVRNRFGLLPEKGTPEKIHQTADGYETAFAKETKALTQGKVMSNGRTFGPEQGASTMLKLDSYYVQFSQTAQSWLKPKMAKQNLEEWQGIRPNLPVTDATRELVKQNEERIRESNVRTPLPAPQVPTDAFMLQFSKDTAAALEPARYELPPPNDYAAAENFAAVSTPVKGDDKSEYQGVKPNLGSDSYMTSFAKTVSAFTPSKHKGKETSKAPIEVTL